MSVLNRDKSQDKHQFYDIFTMQVCSSVASALKTSVVFLSNLLLVGVDHVQDLLGYHSQLLPQTGLVHRRLHLYQLSRDVGVCHPPQLLNLLWAFLPQHLCQVEFPVVSPLRVNREGQGS